MFTVGKYCWKIAKLWDLEGNVSCRTESISVCNMVLQDIALGEFSVKNTLKKYRMESPLNPFSFNLFLQVNTVNKSCELRWCAQSTCSALPSHEQEK